jgi:hypothetical protein
MKKTQLYLLALLVSAIGLSWAWYKWQVLQFPLSPREEVEVWSIEARLEFQGNGGPNKVRLQLPSRGPGAIPSFTVIDERLISRGYSEQVTKTKEGRQVEWVVRRAAGRQVLYYRANIVRDTAAAIETGEPKLRTPPDLTEVQAAAIDTIFEDVKARSADIATFVREFVREFIAENPRDEARVLLDSLRTAEDRAQFIARALAIRNIPARVLHGMSLGEPKAFQQLQPYLQVHNGNQWITMSITTAEEGLPENFFLWTRSARDLLVVESDKRPKVEFAVQRNLADAVAIATRRTEVRSQNLVKYSLLGLPVEMQGVYRILLTVPIGAFVMLILRNVIGFKTFGTFMPVLIALAFRETKIVSGVILFTLVVSLGLLARFYLERLRLLLVPRLTSVLILVILLMSLVSVLAHQLDIPVGLSIALFPMVIMTMTIERMSIAWDERGPGTAIKEGVGTLVVASLAYLVMTWAPLEHLVFVFPELLLVLLGATLLLGRYSGYRLLELFRFRALARERDEAIKKGTAHPDGGAG